MHFGEIERAEALVDLNGISPAQLICGRPLPARWTKSRSPTRDSPAEVSRPALRLARSTRGRRTTGNGAIGSGANEQFDGFRGLNGRDEVDGGI